MRENQSAPPRGDMFRRYGGIACIRWMALSFFVLSPLLCLVQAAPRFISRLFDATDSLTVSAISSAPVEEASVPSISDVLPEENTSDKRASDRTVARGEDGRWLFGTFVLNNPDTGGFVLQVMFANGGVLRHKSGASIKLENLTLIYRNTGEDGAPRVLSLTDTNYRGGGYVYEVSFRPEDDEKNVQERYEMELWGALNANDFRKARAGPYQETARFAIEVNF